jgi:hypothetical protein
MLAGGWESGVAGGRFGRQRPEDRRLLNPATLAIARRLCRGEENLGGDDWRLEFV